MSAPDVPTAIDTVDTIDDDHLAAAAQLMTLIAEEHRRAAEMAAESQARLTLLRQLAARVGDTADPTPPLERLVGMEAVHDWMDEELARVTDEVLIFAPGGAQSPSSLESALERNRDLRTRQVAIRGILLTSATHDQATRDYARRSAQLGVQTRTVASLPLRMIVWDGQVALLPIEIGRDELGAALVRDPVALRALIALFETYWQRAVPFGVRALPDGGPLSPQERVLLQALDQGSRDEDVAARLGISVRTVRRMVSDLADRLGARSRFQLGLLAHRAGWLD